MNKPQIGIIGGGIAGSTIALKLSEYDLDITLFESGSSLVNGPPVCHLHAGGNLYPDIPIKQCVTLLEQSIDTMKLYPECINKRPTIIAVPLRDQSDLSNLLPRLETLKSAYKDMITADPKNELLGKSDDYYQVFERSDLEKIKHTAQHNPPQSNVDWMIPFANEVDLDKLKYPVILVQEYGLSVFRIAATASINLGQLSNCKIKTSCKVTDLTVQDNLKWKVTYQNGPETLDTEFDYIINACGYQTGVLDDLAQLPKKRMVEFKAAYITQWQQAYIWPEVIFHGKRGSKDGMAQLTPYPDGYFQLHGMTEDITLFKEGLVASKDNSAQPQLPPKLISKIQSGWKEEVVESRTQNAIDHLSYFIPDFKHAVHSGKPLYGAQQVPGDDISLRAYDISFENKNYARAEIVKASSAISVAEQLLTEFSKNGLLTAQTQASKTDGYDSGINIDDLAIEIAKERDYPDSLAKI